VTHTRIQYKIMGGHVHASFFSGTARDTVHGKNGDLVFTLDEWETFRKLLAHLPDIIRARLRDIFDLVEERE
jgi:hypothetical protein